MEESVRRVLIAIGIAIASLVLVVGGLSLSMAEDINPITATVTPSQSLTVTITLSPTLATQSITPTLLSGTTPTLCVPPTGWIAVIVQEGQTLQSIALEYNTSVEILMQANCFTSSDVPVGSLVYVPPKASEPVPTQPVCGPPTGWVIYVVRAGDTLYNIAVRYRVTVPQLMFANCLNSTVIYTGQKLYVPNVATSTPSATPQGIVTVTPSMSATTLVVTTPSEATTIVPPTDTTAPTDTLPPTDTPVPPTDTPPPPTAGTP